LNSDFAKHRNLTRSRAAATLLLTLAFAACTEAPAPVCEVLSSAALPGALREASGVAVDAAARAWVIADDGAPIVFQVDDAGRVVHELHLPGVRIEDWEDLAIAACPTGECFHIGEIGDNLHERPHREILRVPVPDGTEPTAAHVERFPFVYPDGPSDAEALVALDDGSLLVVTKGRNRAVGVYRYAAPFAEDSIRTLEHVQNLTDGLVQVPDQVTGGTAGAGRVVLRTYSALYSYEWTGDSLAANGPPIDLGFLGEPQGEGVGAGADGTLVLVGEGTDGGTFARLRCAARD